MGILYIVGAAAHDPEDMTLRALRVLDEADLIVVDSSADTTHVDRLLAHHGIATPVMPPLDSGLSAKIAQILETLRAGDVVFLTLGPSPTPSSPGHRVVRALRDHGFRVEPVPGPSLPVTALILSGFPAGSFRYLGELSQQPRARRALLSSVSAERHTLVLLVPFGQLAEVLPDLANNLGARPLALMRAEGVSVGDIWRGTIGEVPEEHLYRLEPAPTILVVGGERERVARWDDQRLRAEIQNHRNQGLRAKEISQRLAGESGWSRREIYRLAADVEGFREGE